MEPSLSLSFWDELWVCINNEPSPGGSSHSCLTQCRESPSLVMTERSHMLGHSCGGYKGDAARTNLSLLLFWSTHLSDCLRILQCFPFARGQSSGGKMRKSAFESGTWTCVTFHLMLKVSPVVAVCWSLFWVFTVVKAQGLRSLAPWVQVLLCHTWPWTGSLTTLRVCFCISKMREQWGSFKWV